LGLNCIVWELLWEYKTLDDIMGLLLARGDETIMESVGIIRLIDHVGRVVLPMELRNTMNLGENAPLEIFVDGNKIVLKKYLSGCLFCGNGDGLTDIKGKKVCGVCWEEI